MQRVDKKLVEMPFKMGVNIIEFCWSVSSSKLLLEGMFVTNVKTTENMFCGVQDQCLFHCPGSGSYHDGQLNTGTVPSSILLQ